MKPGTHIRLPDGRKATVVYNGLDGVGIKWGIHNPDPSIFDGTTGGMFDDVTRLGIDRGTFEWFPDAMLRDPYLSADLPCVGESYTIIDG